MARSAFIFSPNFLRNRSVVPVHWYRSCITLRSGPRQIFRRDWSRYRLADFEVIAREKGTMRVREYEIGVITSWTWGNKILGVLKWQRSFLKIWSVSIFISFGTRLFFCGWGLFIVLPLIFNQYCSLFWKIFACVNLSKFQVSKASKNTFFQHV